MFTEEKVVSAQNTGSSELSLPGNVHVNKETPSCRTTCQRRLGAHLDVGEVHDPRGEWSRVVYADVAVDVRHDSFRGATEAANLVEVHLRKSSKPSEWKTVSRKAKEMTTCKVMGLWKDLRTWEAWGPDQYCGREGSGGRRPLGVLRGVGPPRGRLYLSRPPSAVTT